jgi:S-adenosylmethionine hydrolase
VSGPVISFLSDYGLVDDFVGVCHGVIAGICPDARIIDITHGIGRHDVRMGAVVLRGALAYMPAGVHVAVVDPDVGAGRRAVALRLADERVLVGPDNGLLWPAAERHGGVLEAVEISRSPLRLEPLSATFHGRDIFAPVAAHIAGGTRLGEVGEPYDPSELVKLELPAARPAGRAILADALYVDRFGNVQLGASHEDLEETGLKLGHAVLLELESGGSYGARYVRTFSDAQPGELIVYEDAYRTLAVAVRGGNAAERLGLGAHDTLRITPA